VQVYIIMIPRYQVELLIGKNYVHIYIYIYHYDT